MRKGASDEGSGNVAEEASAHHPARPASTEGSLQSPGMSNLGSRSQSSQGLRVILARRCRSVAGRQLFAQVPQDLRSLLLGELREGFGVSLLDGIWWRRAQKVPVPLERLRISGGITSRHPTRWTFAFAKGAVQVAHMSILSF